MKTVQQLQEQVYQQALSSGYFRNMQAQLKSYVFDLIEKQYGGGKNRGFQYEHPLLQKMRQYPLTSLCMDLIQQFLESFKFKHTLNVFKKQINRNYNVNRKALAQQFRIQIRNPEAQAVLVSIVTQMVSGEIGAVRDVRQQQQPMKNNFIQKKQQPPARNNYMMSQSQKPMASTQGSIKSTPNQPAFPPAQVPEKSINQSSSINNSYSSSNITSEQKGSSIQAPPSKSNDSSAANAEPSSQVLAPSSSNIDTSSKPSDLKEEKKGKDKKKAKPQKEKPPEGASDLLGDVMQKFKALEKTNKEQEKKNIFEAKRAFSQQKKAKVVDQAESGANKIRGASMGKGMSSMMSKFMPQAFQQPKNQSYVDQELDEFQISRDSTRKNPLFSSSQSGFDKSGFDYSVDSNSIDQYEYSERARKVFKKV